jgi:hypothetical protein
MYSVADFCLGSRFNLHRQSGNDEHHFFPKGKNFKLKMGAHHPSSVVQGKKQPMRTGLL